MQQAKKKNLSIEILTFILSIKFSVVVCIFYSRLLLLEVVLLYWKKFVIRSSKDKSSPSCYSPGSLRIQVGRKIIQIENMTLIHHLHCGKVYHFVMLSRETQHMLLSPAPYSCNNSYKQKPGCVLHFPVSLGKRRWHQRLADAAGARSCKSRETVSPSKSRDDRVK